MWTALKEAALVVVTIVVVSGLAGFAFSFAWHIAKKRAEK